MSDDDYSSLSDLDSDWEDDSYRTQRKGRKRSKPDKDSYKIKNALKAPRATTYTAQALFDQIVSGDIDLDPEYQRDVVWPEAKQVGLIDSIFRNFYIPPVIFSVNAHEDGSESKICIDGKQRLTSIYRFMLGLIHHRDRVTGEKYWYKDSPAPETGRRRKRQILPDKYRRLFANKQIVCVEYSDIGDKDEREIFQRVQLGMALTPAEKLGVVKTHRADFVREIQSRYFKDEDRGLSSNTNLDWDRSRGTDFRCIATFFWCIDRYLTSPSSLNNAGTMPQIESFLSDASPVTPTFRKAVLETFKVLEEMVKDENVNTVFKSPSGSGNVKVSPIEFICICLLIMVWRDKMNVEALGQAVGEMRRVVRREHVDIRLNTKVAKTMIVFVKELKVQDYVGGPSGKDGVKVGVKRKRALSDDVSMSGDSPNESKPLKKSPSVKPADTFKTPTTTAQPTPSAPPLQTQSSQPAQVVPPKIDRLASIRALRAQQLYQQTQNQHQVKDDGQSMLPSPG